MSDHVIGKATPASGVPPTSSLETAFKTVVQGPGETKVETVDANNLVAVVWMLYKLNVITRIQVRDFMDIIKAGKWPENMVGYLTTEITKLG